MNALEVHENVRICKVDTAGIEVSIDLYGGEAFLIGSASYLLPDAARRLEVIVALTHWMKTEALLAYIRDVDDRGSLMEMNQYVQVRDGQT